jgi:hypothetical protein
MIKDYLTINNVIILLIVLIIIYFFNKKYIKENLPGDNIVNDIVNNIGNDRNNKTTYKVCKNANGPCHNEYIGNKLCILSILDNPDNHFISICFLGGGNGNGNGPPKDYNCQRKPKIENSQFKKYIVDQLNGRKMVDKLKNKLIWIEYRYIGREMWILYYINNDGAVYNLTNSGENYHLRIPYNRDKNGNLINTIGNISGEDRFQHFINLLDSDIKGTLQSELFEKDKTGVDTKIRFKEVINGRETDKFKHLRFNITYIGSIFP